MIYDGDGQRIVTVDSSGTKVSLDKLYEKNLTTGDQALFLYRLDAPRNGILAATCGVARPWCGCATRFIG